MTESIAKNGRMEGRNLDGRTDLSLFVGHEFEIYISEYAINTILVGNHRAFLCRIL